MQQVKSFLSYFDPTTSKFEGTWSAFDQQLKFEQQLLVITLTALATIISLPILGLGGMAAFRALVNHYTRIDTSNFPSNSMGSTAEKTHHTSRNTFEELSQEQFMEKAALLLDSSGSRLDSEFESILQKLYLKYKNPNILLLALKEGSLRERKEVLLCALKLEGSFRSVHEFKKLIKFVYTLNTKRLETVDKLEQHCNGLQTVKDISLIYLKLKDIPADEEAEILSAFSLISSQFSEVVDRVACLEVIRANIPKGQRLQVIESNRELLSYVRSSHFLSKTLKPIQEIPEGSKKYVANLAQRLTSSTDVGMTLEKILLCVADTPEEMHKQLLENIVKCLEGINEEELIPVIQILDQIIRLDKEQRVDVIGVAMSHITSNMAPYERRLILGALLDAGSENRHGIQDAELQEMIRVKKLMITFFGSLKDDVNKQEIFSEINRIPENQREALFAALAPALGKVQTAEAFKELINGIKMIAPAFRESVLQHYSGVFDSAFKWKHLVQDAFERHPRGAEILASSKDYLRTLLETETDEVVGRDIAQKIWDNRLTFGIQDEGEDPLFTVLIGIIPVEQGHHSTSYGIFRQLLQLDKEVKTPIIRTPAEKISNHRVRIDQPFFEKMVRDSKQVTFGDLPENINLKTLEDLFAAFEKRIGGLSHSDKDSAWVVGVSGCMMAQAGMNANPTQGSVSSSYQNTKRDFMASTYIRNTIARTGSDPQQVPKGYLHLYAVIRFIKNSSTEINPRTGLSDQEEVLLKMLSSVQHCGTGKSEGLAEFYSSLPSHARFHGAARGEKKADKAKEYLAAIAQSVLAKYLEDYGDMARELTGRNAEDSQWVHTRKYLKNMIAKRIGLEWDIAFDAYPGCINGTLKSRSLDEMLNIFYKHITPSKFLHDMLNHIKQDILPNADTIEEVKSRLERTQNQLEILQGQGNMPALLEVQRTLRGQEFTKKQGLQIAKRDLLQLREFDPQVREALVKAQEAIDGANNELRIWESEKKLNDAQLKAERERLGIPAIEVEIESIESELEGHLENINQELVDQLSALLVASGRKNFNQHECWEPLDGYGLKNTVTPAGVVNALIEAGYFAEA